MAKRKMQKWHDGDLFLVPQPDGGYTLGQVYSYQFHAMDSALCAFSLVRMTVQDSPSELPIDKIISIRFVTTDLLNSGDWPIVAEAQVPDFSDIFDLEKHIRKEFVGTKVQGSGNIMSFLNACLGLEAWDQNHDPHYFDSLLISPQKKPKLLQYKSDIMRN